MPSPTLLPTLIPYTQEVQPALGTVKYYDAFWARKAPWISEQGVVYDQRSGLGTDRPPQPRRCLELNGTNQYGFYQLPDPIDQFPFTLFGWVRKADTSLEAFVGVGAISDGNKFFGLWANQGSTLRVNRRNGPIGTETLDDVSMADKPDQWSSYVCSFLSPTEAVVYRDGVLEETLTGLDSISPDADFVRFVTGTRRQPANDNHWSGKAMHCGYLRRAATLEDAVTFHNTGIIPNAEGLFPLDSNSTTVAYNIGTEGAPFERRNLLTWSEDFTNGVWTKVGTTDAVSVGGGAFRLDNFSDANGARVQQRIPSAPSATWTGTIDVRGEGSDIGKPINILLIRGTTGTTVSNSVTVNLTADWQRVEVSRTLAADNIDVDIRVNMVTGGPDAPFVRFPQLELGDTATDYQPITTGIYTNEMTLVNGTSGMLYEGRDVPLSRQNEVGYSERRNLLIQTENMSVSPWGQINNLTREYLGDLAPDGTPTATRLTSTGNGILTQVMSVKTGQMSVSIWVKAISAATVQQLGWRENLGPVKVGLNYALTGEWQKIEFTGVSEATTNLHFWLRTQAAASTILVWHPQFESGETTEYQRIVSDPGTDVLFPATLHTPGESAAGDALTYTGKAHFDAQAEEANCLTFDGVDDYIALTDEDWDAIAGPELVTNGTFDSNIDGWTSVSGAVLAWDAGRLSVTRVGGAVSRANVAVSTEIGATYLVKYTQVDSPVSTAVRVGQSPGSISVISYSSETTGFSEQSFTFTAEGTTTNLSFSPGSDTTALFDNVSVRKIPTPSVPRLSENLVPNPNFDDASSWLATSVTISGGKASWTGSTGNILSSYLLTAGKYYKVTFEMSDWVAGNIRVRDGNLNFGFESGNGTKEIIFRATGAGFAFHSFDANAEFSIDNVSLQIIEDVESQGTSILSYTYNGDGIVGTAGTAYEIKLGDKELIPCSEGLGAEVHGVIRNKSYSIVNGQSSMWENKQDNYHYNLVHGFTANDRDQDVAELRSLLLTHEQPVMLYLPFSNEMIDLGYAFGATQADTFLDQGRNLYNATAAGAGRPGWGRVPKTGRRNLLEKTEDFNDGYWSKATMSVASGVPDPVGGTTAFTLTANADNSAIFRLLNGLSGTHRNSIWIRRRTGTGIVRFYVGNGSSTEQMQSVITTDWQRLSTAEATASGSNDRFGVLLVTSGDEVDVWHPQFESGSNVTPYQKVTTAFDITEAGVRDCYYLLADGVNTGMSTPTIPFSGTNKVTVWASVRKLSDAAAGMLVELSPVFSNPGTFYIRAPRTVAEASYDFGSSGSVSAVTRNVIATPFASPTTNILTGQSDISSPFVSLRVNGNDIGTVTASQGTGNFIDQVLYLFRRNLTNTPFNGQCFGLLVAGDNYPLSTIQRVERILSRWTPEIDL